MGVMGARVARPEGARILVRYTSARYLLEDFAAGAARGGLAVKSSAQLQVGAEFVFELAAADLHYAIELKARVVWTRPAREGGKQIIGLQYDFDAFETLGVTRLEASMQNHLGGSPVPLQRVHRRVPLAVEVLGGDQQWRLRDLSVGGALLQSTTTENLSLAVGDAVQLVFCSKALEFHVDGHVAWLTQPTPKQGDKLAPGRFGLKFVDMTPDLKDRISQLMRGQVRAERVMLVTQKKR
jgi:Tfp pilus assembly protein PilZ